MPASSAESTLIRRPISGAELSHLFFDISNEIGYTHEIAGTYVDHLNDLLSFWDAQGFIEIYSDDKDRQWGRVKDSNNAPGSTPWYMGLYHARLVPTGENDPLVVVAFDEQTADGENTHVVSVRFMLDHADMFGEGSEKFNPAKMKEIRKRIYEFVKQAGYPALFDKAS